jgi:AbrB family looped-hinge helix DNA binding protein
MNMPSVIGKRGQIVIGKPIRDALGLKPGYIAVQHLVDDHVEIFFYPPEHGKSLRGILAHYAKRSEPVEDWQKVREEAWSNMVRSEWEKHEGDS